MGQLFSQPEVPVDHDQAQSSTEENVAQKMDEDENPF